MIKKFTKIHGVGRFSDYSARGDGLSLGKINIIYGENSAGKTTLVSIVKSLLTNEPSIIIERKTYGQEDQYCEILCEENQQSLNYKFQGNLWDGNLRDVEIFDVYFVNDNVYTGLSISSEHQKKLYQFALGEEGVNLAKEIEEIKRDLQKKHEKLNNLKNQIELVVERNITVQDFVTLTKDESIGKKIENKKQEIKIAEAGQKIREKQLLVVVSRLELPVDLTNLKNLLQRNIQEISKEYLEKVEEHKKKLHPVMVDETESWLQQGLSYVQTTQDGKCPFCQQNLKEAESVIDAYRQYFNEEYKELKRNIVDYLKEVNKCSIEEVLNKKKNTILENNTLIEFWKTYLPKLEISDVDLESLSLNIKTEFTKIKQLIGTKLGNILESVDTELLDHFISLLQKINSAIDIYNSQINEWNDEIKELKKKQPDLAKLKEELARLEVQQKRFLPEVNKVCEDYRTIWKGVESQKQIVAEKEKQLKSAVSEKIIKYGKEINVYLEKFGISYRIQETKPMYRGRSKEPYLDYGIALQDYRIDLQEQLPHCMGEGDRNALAFAFFLAKLNLDEQIDKKIIIFDDPVSSLDRNRRRRTVEYIRDLSNKTRQVILLTHNDGFAFELYNTLKDIGMKPATREICNGKIDEWNIEEAMKHPYFIRIAKLERFLDMDETISAAEARELIRLVLEDSLKFRYFKYFEQLGDNCWLGPMVGKLREAIEDDNFQFKHTNKDEVVNELSNLCDLSGPAHHGGIAQPHKQDLSPEEIKNYVNLTLRIIFEWL